MPIFLTELVAQRIVDRSMAIINYNVNVMDRTGIILGSGDSHRLHQVHEGALKVLEHGQAYSIAHTHAQKIRGAQPGINLPIRFRGEIIGVVGISGSPEKVTQFADLVVMTAELMIENASMMSEIHWNKRQCENIIFEMIHGEAEQDDLFKIRTKRLGIDPNLPRVPIVISMKTKAGKDLSIEEIEQVHQVLEQGHPDDLIAMVCPTQAVLLHTIPATRDCHSNQMSEFIQTTINRLKAFGKIDFCIAQGAYIPGIKNIPLAYRSAQEALQLGNRLNPGKYSYCYHDYQMDSLLLELTNSWKAWELKALIQPLIQTDKNNTLTKTLRVFISQHADISATSQQLHIHRNTLSYRLERIENLTGRNPKLFNDLIFLHFSLRLHEIKGDIRTQSLIV